MPNTITPNMSLIVPTVGAELGPTYAVDINNSLSLIDSHDHSSGKGVAVTPAGLSITSDLTFQGNNATNLRSARLSIQTSPLALSTDLNCLYDVNGNLYFNDGSGNQIQITSNGGVNSSNGNITGLIAPAALSYVSATPAFVATSSPGVPANFDGGSLTIRKVTSGSHGITLSAPASLPADYSLTFPSALPASVSAVEVDNSGNITFSSSGLVPTGTLLDFAGTSAPTGFLPCNGSAVSRTTYAGLFAAIGVTWGSGDGSTTFNVPDFSRRTAVGSGGTGTGVLGNAVGNVGGAETHSLSSSELASHNHSGTTNSFNLDIITENNTVNPGTPIALAGSYPQRVAVNSSTTGYLSQDIMIGSSGVGFTTGNTGSGTAFNIMQPSAVVLKIIKT